MSETDFSFFEKKLTQQGQPQDRAIPRFHTQNLHMVNASKEAGRPIYEEREYVEIIIPGSRSAHVEPVNDGHKLRWPEAYQAFKDGREMPLAGTPLMNWPSSSMTSARVEELAFFKIRTIEDLAGVDDITLQRLGMGAREQREAARKFLEVAKTGTGPLERLISENFRLTDEVKRQAATITEQAAMIEGLRAALNKEPVHAR